MSKYEEQRKQLNRNWLVLAISWVLIAIGLLVDSSAILFVSVGLNAAVIIIDILMLLED